MMAVIIFLPKNFLYRIRAMRSPRINLNATPTNTHTKVFLNMRGVSGLANRSAKFCRPTKIMSPFTFRSKKDM